MPNIFRLPNYLPNPLTRRLSSICSRHQDILLLSV